MYQCISEKQFKDRLKHKLDRLDFKPMFVTGPGRSGAIAAVYASHYLGVPFVPYKCGLKRDGFLIVDTNKSTGKTIRRASRIYNGAPHISAFSVKGRLIFWYEKEYKNFK